MSEKSDFSEHKKIVSDNFLCRKLLLGIFMHPENPKQNEEDFLDLTFFN